MDDHPFNVSERVRRQASQWLERIASVRESEIKTDENGDVDCIYARQGQTQFSIERIDSLWWNLTVSNNGDELICMNFKSTEFVSRGEIEFGWKATDADLADQGWADWEKD